MEAIASRAWFSACRLLGGLLRAGRYARVRTVREGEQCWVIKRRSFYAPALVAIGRPLMRALGTGVRVLPQREWEQRERELYRDLYSLAIRTEGDGTLSLPFLAGETLAAILEQQALDDSARIHALSLASQSLREIHAIGLTHGDAMAENVLVDLGAGVARWFDFETMHETCRPAEWCRADDVRALLATCLLRTPPGKRRATLHHLLDAYADEGITCELRSCFAMDGRLALIFHLGQAPLPFDAFRNIGTLLRERAGS
jgi:hypothetical protein